MEEDLLEEDFREASKLVFKPIVFFYYILQIFLLAIGATLIYYCGALMVAAKGPPTPDGLYTGFLEFGVITGIITVGYSVFGMVAVAWKSQKLGTAYILVFALVMFTTIWQIWWVEYRLKEMAGQMSDVWDTLNDATKRSLQALGGCCGFAHPGDRSVTPCSSLIPGCFPPDESSPVLEGLRALLLMSISSVFFFGFILCMIAVFILFVHESRQRLQKAKKDISTHL